MEKYKNQQNAQAVNLSLNEDLFMHITRIIENLFLWNGYVLDVMASGIEASKNNLESLKEKESGE